ncbi:hypothetical protein EW146_g7973 [Bondarzewia mesenterica]|uniref:Uncharacterized protein n=1 Tax=Bondarzewia mesenterica TaxID=1095465 RepID=A0A4S4LHY8_9AGAM|nr:hypothetical protein EW146_g7973 [Bondarzewia mesenterica]
MGVATSPVPESAQDESTSFYDDKAELTSLLPTYSSSSATVWLDIERYKIWRPTDAIPESYFRPMQGYLRSDPFILA